MRGRGVVGAVIAVTAVVILFWRAPAGTEAPADPGAATAAAPSWSDADWEVFASAVRRAAGEGVDTLPLGDAMARVGLSFVGTPYEAATLEAEGPEGLVVNFRGLDCVTFVETAFATARFVRAGGADLLDDRGRAEDRYEALLTEVRYRDGRIDGYPSRLHYFSDWIADNAARGLVRDLGPELATVRDDEPIDFMTTHPDAYRQLADGGNVSAVRAAEERLSSAGRWYLPAASIEGAAPGIRDGDVIAATSTVAGLDVAHTGLALWRDGALHLLHAPLAGGVVTVSEVPLAERIAGIRGQDGIMVARPTADGGS